MAMESAAYRYRAKRAVGISASREGGWRWNSENVRPRPNLGEGENMVARDDAAHPVEPPNIISFTAAHYILCDLRQHNNKRMRDITIFILDLYRFEVLAPM